MASRYKPQVIGEKYIDATNQIVGRLASHVAKLALLGYRVHIVNAEKAIVTGKKENVIEFFREKVERGDVYKGPFYPKRADRILKRIIRGMLPWSSWRGRLAYKRIKTYIGVPEEFKDKEFERFPDADVSKLEKSGRLYWYVTLEEVSKALGAKIIKPDQINK